MQEKKRPLVDFEKRVLEATRTGDWTGIYPGAALNEAMEVLRRRGLLNTKEVS